MTTYSEKRATDPAQPLADGDLWAVTQDVAGTPTSNVATSAEMRVYFQSGIDAASITTGVLNIARIPPAAIEKLFITTNQTTRYALTTADVQNGDTVKQASDGLMFYVVDDTNLDNATGYAVYTTGAAAIVPWSGITGTPTTLAGYGITDPIALTNVLNVFTKSQIVAPVINNTATGTITPDMSASSNFEYLLTGNLIIANPAIAATNFQSGLFRLKQDGSGGRTIGFGAKFKFKVTPVFSTAIHAVDYVSYIYNSIDDRYDCLLNAGF